VGENQMAKPGSVISEDECQEEVRERKRFGHLIDKKVLVCQYHDA
jgi:hypothetical protein